MFEWVSLYLNVHPNAQLWCGTCFIRKTIYICGCILTYSVSPPLKTDGRQSYENYAHAPSSNLVSVVLYRTTPQKPRGNHHGLWPVLSSDRTPTNRIGKWFHQKHHGGGGSRWDLHHMHICGPNTCLKGFCYVWICNEQLCCSTCFISKTMARCMLWTCVSPRPHLY